jgi:hypothetical protein
MLQSNALPSAPPGAKHSRLCCIRGMCTGAELTKCSCSWAEDWSTPVVNSAVPADQQLHALLSLNPPPDTCCNTARRMHTCWFNTCRTCTPPPPAATVSLHQLWNQHWVLCSTHSGDTSWSVCTRPVPLAPTVRAHSLMDSTCAELSATRQHPTRECGVACFQRRVGVRPAPVAALPLGAPGPVGVASCGSCVMSYCPPTTTSMVASMGGSGSLSRYLWCVGVTGV